MRAYLLVVLVVGASARAQAAPVADVVVAWGPTPLGKVGDAIADAAGRAGASYVDQSGPAQVLPDPRPLIKRGIAAYSSLELEAAAGAFDAAVEFVDQTGAAGLDTATLADLFLYRALAYAQRTDDTRSWDDLVAAAGIDPARVLDPAGFPPRAIERFEQAKAHVGALPHAKVTFATTGCRIRVDAAPINGAEVELSFGRHWIEAACDGHEPVRKRIAVDRPVLTLVVAGAPIVQPDDTAALVQARAASARAVVVVTMQGRTAVIRRLGVLDGKQQERVSITLTGDRQARDIGAAVGRMLAPIVVRPQPWYRSRWVWLAAGAVAASAVLIPLAARSGGEAPAVVIRPQDQPSW
ncbi:MAG: hypothetical protein ABI867_38345 [Kofleriaceae bacterium]